MELELKSFKRIFISYFVPPPQLTFRWKRNVIEDLTTTSKPCLAGQSRSLRGIGDPILLRPPGLQTLRAMGQHMPAQARVVQKKAITRAKWRSLPLLGRTLDPLRKKWQNIAQERGEIPAIFLPPKICRTKTQGTRTPAKKAGIQTTPLKSSGGPFANFAQMSKGD